MGGQLVSAPPLFVRFPSSGRDSSTRESGDGRDLPVVWELRKFSRWSAEGQRPFRPSREMGLSSGCDTRTVPLAKSRCPTPQLALRSLVLVAREKIPGDVEAVRIDDFPVEVFGIAEIVSRDCAGVANVRGLRTVRGNRQRLPASVLLRSDDSTQSLHKSACSVSALRSGPATGECLGCQTLQSRFLNCRNRARNVWLRAGATP